MALCCSARIPLRLVEGGTFHPSGGLTPILLRRGRALWWFTFQTDDQWGLTLRPRPAKPRNGQPLELKSDSSLHKRPPISILRTGAGFTSVKLQTLLGTMRTLLPGLLCNTWSTRTARQLRLHGNITIFTGHLLISALSR